MGSIFQKKFLRNGIDKPADEARLMIFGNRKGHL